MRRVQHCSSNADSDHSTALEEALGAWQKIPNILQTLGDETSSNFGSIAKGVKKKTNFMSKPMQAIRGAENVVKATGKTLIQGASYVGHVAIDNTEPAPSTEDTVVQGNLPAADSGRSPGGMEAPVVAVEFQDTEDWAFFMLASSVIVVAVVSTYTQYDLAKGSTTVPWNLVVPWLGAATFLGYSFGYHQRCSEMVRLTNEGVQSKTQAVDETIRRAHYEISTKGEYKPPAPLPTKRKSVMKRVLDPVGLGGIQSWRRRPVDQVDLRKSALDVSALTMENTDEGEASLFLRIPMPVSSVTTLDEYTSQLSSNKAITNLGMDLFFNGGEPVSNVSSHPALIGTLRRKAPMLIINAMTHIANVILYFQLPDWVTSWSSLQETPTNESGKGDKANDDLETRILRDFLLGTDEYRNERLVVVPQIVDAPLPVKVIAPKKTQILVKAQSVPSCWYRSEDRADLCPALELEMDMIANSTIRSVVGIVSRHLHRISLDLACLVYDKDKKTSVCLTCFCFDHIDMTACPSFPQAPQSLSVVGQERIATNTEPELQAVPAVA